MLRDGGRRTCLRKETKPSSRNIDHLQPSYHGGNKRRYSYGRREVEKESDD